MRLLFLIFAILLTPVAAQADATIVNFDGAGTGQGDQISHHDISGNKMQLESGPTLQCQSGMPNCPAGTFYVYGQGDDCGALQAYTNSQFCGFKVYSTTDYINFTYVGNLFDPSGFQAQCRYDPCDRPHVVYNAANNNYVLWFNQAVSISGTPPSTPTAAQGFFVFTCTSPYGGCTQQADPSHLTVQGGADYEIYVDNPTTAYIAYRDPSGTQTIHVQQLNASFTDATGTATDTGQQGEAVQMFQRSGTYYILFSSLCDYCNGTNTSYISASSALGSYSGPTQLSANSCNGQPRALDVITAGGNTTYLLSEDQNNGLASQALSNVYYQPLSFNGSAINPFTCATTVTIPGLPAATYTPNLAINGQVMDQSVNLGIEAYLVYCAKWIANAHMAFFTFKPTKTPLSYVAMEIGFNNTNCTASLTAVSACSTPNADLVVSLTTVTGGNTPGTTLVSATIPASGMSWTPKWTQVALPYAVTPGTEYGVLINGPQTDGSCYSYEQSTSNQYANGIEAYTGDGGTTWTVVSTTSIMFATYSPSATLNNSPAFARGLFFRAGH